MKDEGKSRPASMPLIAAIFFASGFSALIYQITWQRSLFVIFGINVEAVTVVVTGFLLGLGFGSLLGGRLSRIMPASLLTLFGLIELTIGLFGAASLAVFQWVGARTLELSGPLTVAVTVTLLIGPTLLMGATLPILTQYLVSRIANVGRSVGLLYCVNTLGSAFACFASGLWLMRWLGMQGAVTLAAAVNLAVAAVAFRLAWRARMPAVRPVPELSPQPEALPLRHGLSFAFLFVIAVLTGYMSLSYEVVWFRAFVIGTNLAPAFALILGAYLAGLAAGSYLIRNSCVPSASGAGPIALLCHVIVLSSVIGYLVLPIAARAAAGGTDWFAASMLLTVFLQTAIAGSAFPLICYLGVAPDGSSGVGVSYVYVGNILGSAAGALITGFVLMDYMSTALISLLLVELGAVTAAGVALAGRAHMPGRRRAGVLALVAGTIVVSPLAAASLFDRFYDRITYKSDLATEPEFVDVVENKSGVVTVSSQAVVFGGGMYDGIVSVDLIDDRNLLIRPLSLALFHPAPRDVLMIGLATGAWAQIVAANPAVERLTIVEINPGYLQLIRKYDAVRTLLGNPKVEIIIDDGRRWLNRHPGRRFDAIIQNTTWHFRPHVTNLLSAEYLKLAATRLRDGGILMYNTTYSTRAMLTGCTVLPFGLRELNMMVAGNGPLTLDHARLRRMLDELTIDGKPAFDRSDPRQRRRIDDIVAELEAFQDSHGGTMESCDSIKARAKGLRLITDDNMGEEWQARGGR